MICWFYNWNKDVEIERFDDMRYSMRDSLWDCLLAAEYWAVDWAFLLVR